MHYAIIRSGIVQNVIEWDGISPYNPESGCTVIQSDVAGCGDSFDGTSFTRSIPVINYTILAKEALNATDLTALRCFKAGIAFPAAWQTYTLALRSIITTGTGTLPVKPVFPAGT